MTGPTCPPWCSPSRCERLLGGLHRGRAYTVGTPGRSPYLMRVALWAVDLGQPPMVEMVLIPSGAGVTVHRVDLSLDTAADLADRLTEAVKEGTP